ncbi:unnamed protein product [Linum tenue]|uniref:Retrovirus-related Pol polyprotein from transposon TNT 1-94 n=1 Tax=Linum tenue TaxID=586396 RepID=A0AAV0LJ87_9ROSI|nr:unnamed protein product [Linum tenue]
MIYTRLEVRGTPCMACTRLGFRVGPGSLSRKMKKIGLGDEEWNTLEEKAHSTIILSLSDDIIIEVASKKTVASLWLKLESMYMTTSLTNELHLK